MIFHSQYTLTIGEYEVMYTTGNTKLLKRLPIPLPNFILKRAYLRFIEDYNKTVNKDKVEILLEKSYEKLEVANLLVFLEALTNLIEIAAQIGESNTEFVKIYKSYYNKEPKTKEDYEAPFKEKELLSIRANAEYGQKEESVPIDLPKLIMTIEKILKTKIRSERLYLLPLYINNASKTK